jgi:anthranilate phosphoribosyltransferase
MEEFREFIKKIGSGPHTGKSLSRAEAALAMKKMLLAEATPAQIGAFLIAHRIRRPTGDEMAGMLDTWTEFGPQLQPVSEVTPRVFGIPYDGRSRTAPLGLVTGLLLAAVDVPVILHGGDRMPTKYGLPLIDFWRHWGADWSALDMDKVQRVYAATNLAFVYTPRHFPLAQGLVTYREQIGKRPPIATLELLWTPYAAASHLIFGYVHPPTEKTALAALEMRGNVLTTTTVKGLEGSCDLPHDRTVIVGTGSQSALERILLHHQDYGVTNINPALTENIFVDIDHLLQGKPNGLEQDKSNGLLESAVWNGGFYLWHCGIAADMLTGMEQARELLASGRVLQKLQQIIAQISG